MTLSIENPVLASIALVGVAACMALLAWFLGRNALRAGGDVLGFVGLLSATSPSGARSASLRGSLGALVPLRVGPYVLTDKIGQGAMGQVYRARHLASGDWRAVKLLPRDASVRDRARFDDEALLGASVRHENAVSIMDRGVTRDGTAYIAMELLVGVSLQELVEREGPLSSERAIRILRQLCAALAEAHDQGLVHRDVKPDNVIVCAGAGGNEQVKLIDFGLVQRVGDASSAASADAVVGTPLYLSPEAITAPESVDVQSDLYALGGVAYFLLSGAPVFDGHNVVEVCCQHLHSAPASLRGKSLAVSEELDRIVLDCLAKGPEARPASAKELAERLERCAASERRRGAPRSARVARIAPRRAAAERACAAAA